MKKYDDQRFRDYNVVVINTFLAKILTSTKLNYNVYGKCTNEQQLTFSCI